MNLNSKAFFTNAPFVFALIFGIAFIPRFGIFIAIPLMALALTLSIFLMGWTLVAWRWAALGSGLWFLEEAIWAVVRLQGFSDTEWLTDMFYFSGAAAWFIALHLMPQRMLPSRNVLLGFPIILFLFWMLTQSSRSLFLNFPLVETFLFFYSVPAIEAAFQGRVSEGRILWGFGFLIRALSSGLYAWLSPQQETVILFYWLALLSYGFIFWGSWLELKGRHPSLWIAAYSIIALESIGTLVHLMVNRSLESRMVQNITSGVLAYLLFYGVMVMLDTDRRRRIKAERELKSYADLLESLVGFQPDVSITASGPWDILEKTLLQLFNSLQQALPALQGLQLQLEKAITLGESKGYAFALEHEHKPLGHIYFLEPLDDMRFIKAFAPLLANHIQTTLSHLSSQNQAMTDPLTKLLNRRGFEVQVTQLLNQARETQDVISIAMLDLDYFKRVNDEFGHETGDKTLKNLAEILQRNVRARDLVVRWGGEEFLLVLYGTSLATTREVIKRISNELNDHPLQPIPWTLTLSAGVAGGQSPIDTSMLIQWIGEADKALLRAKEAGRDRIEVAV
jgi:diguanylate cyclase (GGDEF)-like protein